MQTPTKTKPEKNGKAAIAEKPEQTITTSSQMGENLVTLQAKKTRRFTLILVGVSALLTDPMGDDVLNALRTGDKLQINKTRTLEQICEGRLYKDESGEITMPATNLLAALNYAGGFFNYPGTKKNLSTGATSLIPSFLRIESESIKFTSDGWKPDQRRGRLANGTAVSIVRPKFKNWSVELTIQLDDKEPIKIDTVIALFEKAGKASGLGSFRPSCKGNFGQFDVTSCIEIPLDA